MVLLERFAEISSLGLERDLDELPNVKWSDDEIVKYARQISREMGIPIVRVALCGAVEVDGVNTAEVNFFGPITVRRFNNVLAKSQ